MSRNRSEADRFAASRPFMAAYYRLLAADRPLPKQEGETVAKSTQGIGPKGQAKADRVFKEFGKGQLHSGSPKGPVVTNPKQATAIALSQARDVSRGKK